MRRDERPWRFGPLPRMLGVMWIDQRGSEILSRPECLRLLALEAKVGGIGRLAVSRQGAPIVQPVNFVYRGGELFVLLGEGLLWDTAPGQLVALEVDKVDGEAGVAWSVLVRGLARAVGSAGPGMSGGESPRPLAPVPGNHLVSLRVDVVTGRRFPLVADRDRPTAGGWEEIHGSAVTS